MFIPVEAARMESLPSSSVIQSDVWFLVSLCLGAWPSLHVGIFVLAKAALQTLFHRKICLQVLICFPNTL